MRSRIAETHDDWTSFLAAEWITDGISFWSPSSTGRPFVLSGASQEEVQRRYNLKFVEECFDTNVGTPESVCRECLVVQNH